MARELPSMKDARAFLGCEFSNHKRGDLSLISQVELWSTNAKVFDTFGADIERISCSFVDSIDQLKHLYDNWHKDWQPILSPLSHLLQGGHQSHTQPLQINDCVLNLYFSAARLQLFSHVFRGPAQRTSQPPIRVGSSNELSKFAGQAVKCALDHLDSLTSILSSGTSFGILPAYLTTTVAFSGVFLSRIPILQHNAIATEHEKTACIETVDRLCEALRNLAREGAPRGEINSASQSLLLKIINALESAREINHGEALRISEDDPEHFGSAITQESPFNFHASHEVFDANGFDIFYIDMPLDFDFSFMDGNFAWNGAEEQAS